MNGEAADPVKSPLPVGCSSEFQARKDPCSKKLKKKQHNGKSHGPQPTSLYMPRSSRGSDVANSHLQGDPHGLAGSRTDRNLWLVTSKMVTTTSAWPSFQTEVRNWLPLLDGPKQTLRLEGGGQGEVPGFNTCANKCWHLGPGTASLEPSGAHEGLC